MAAPHSTVPRSTASASAESVRGPGGGRRPRRRLPVLDIAVGAASVGVLLVAWEIVPRLPAFESSSFPPFSTVLRSTGEVLTDPGFAQDVVASARRWLLGLTIAIVLGTALGLAMGRSRIIHDIVDPVLTLLFPVPKVALVIPLLLVLGSRMDSDQAAEVARVSVIVLGCLIPIVVSSCHGAAEVDERLIWSMQAAGVRGPSRQWRVVLPAALPRILSGIRIALATSLFTLVGSEMLIRQSGVGAYLFDSYDIGQYTTVWAVALLLSVTGFALDKLYVLAVRRALPWWEGEV